MSFKRHGARAARNSAAAGRLNYDMPRPLRLVVAALLAAFAYAPGAAAAPDLPRASTIASGWEVRSEAAQPGAPQPPPPEETQPSGVQTSTPPVASSAQSSTGPWMPVRIPHVFDARALPMLYPGTVKRYRVRFVAPRAPRGFHWLILFESVRRKARVFLNGRFIGRGNEPYAPFAVPARGLRPGRVNDLQVVVDNRKDPRLQEGWWNWGGIVRPVRLVPVGPAYLSGLGLMSRVRCKGPGRRCRAALLIDGTLQRSGRRLLNLELRVSLRAPGGRETVKRFKLGKQGRRKRELSLSMRVPAPRLWAPDHPYLYAARLELRNHGRLQQVERQSIGLRSVQVKGGRLWLNNRPIQLRGASIHEDLPGRGPALRGRDMDLIVRELKQLGANVTRAHYLLNDRLLSRLDRAGIMVWDQAPIWQRDARANLLRTWRDRRRALMTVRRTIRGARSHPSVITHSVANELNTRPDNAPGTRAFLISAARWARKLDPTLPVSLDINGRPGVPEQFTYRYFDMIGINQYFGWYRWVSDFSLLEPYLAEMRDLYPRQALVMTEFGAEARPELADAPEDEKGSYAFQKMHVERTLDVVDRSPVLSGAIYWTLREFEIYPGWTGGAGRREGVEKNTRHNKGLLTYYGARKPAWYVARDHFRATPLYADGAGG